MSITKATDHQNKFVNSLFGKDSQWGRVFHGGPCGACYSPLLPPLRHPGAGHVTGPRDSPARSPDSTAALKTCTLQRFAVSSWLVLVTIARILLLNI